MQSLSASKLGNFHCSLMNFGNFLLEFGHTECFLSLAKERGSRLDDVPNRGILVNLGFEVVDMVLHALAVLHLLLVADPFAHFVNRFQGFLCLKEE